MNDAKPEREVAPEEPVGSEEASDRGVVGRFGVVVLVLAALVVGILIDWLVPERTAPTVLDGEVSEQVWFCPETPLSEGVDSEISVVNVSDEPMAGAVQYRPADGTAPEPIPIEVPVNGRVAVRTSDVSPVGGAAAVTLPPGRAAVGVTVSRPEQAGKPTGVGAYPCAEATARAWYFTAGTTSRGNSLFLHVFNPGEQAAVVDVTHITEEGREARVLNVEGRRAVTLDLGSSEEILGRRESVTTIVSTQAGRVVAAQTLMPNGGTKGFGISLGATGGAPKWYFPSVKVGSGVTQSVRLLNLTDLLNAATLQFTPDTGSETIPPVDVEIPADAAQALDLAPIQDAGVVGLEIIADRDLVAEQLQVADPGVASMVGVAQAANRWLIPWSPPKLGGGVILVQNPLSKEVEIQVFSLAAEGGKKLSQIGDTLTLPPLARTSISIADLAPPDAAAGLLVNLTEPAAVGFAFGQNDDQALTAAIPLP